MHPELRKARNKRELKAAKKFYGLEGFAADMRERLKRERQSKD